MSEQDITDLVRSDNWMMAVLQAADTLDFPDWMIGAGFIRNKVWDSLHNIKRRVADTSDIDLIYFDLNNVSEDADRNLSIKMGGKLGLQWEIVNQAYTHKWHGHNQYTHTAEGMSHWVETATCVAVTIKDNNPVIIAPHGIDDLVNLIVRPSPSRTQDLGLFKQRIQSKEWLKKWPRLRVIID